MKKQGLRALAKETADISFFDTAIKTKFIDVYKGGFYAAIIELSNLLETGELTKKQLKTLAKSLKEDWPALERPKTEKKWGMYCIPKRRKT